MPRLCHYASAAAALRWRGDFQARSSFAAGLALISTFECDAQRHFRSRIEPRSAAQRFALPRQAAPRDHAAADSASHSRRIAALRHAASTSVPEDSQASRLHFFAPQRARFVFGDTMQADNVGSRMPVRRHAASWIPTRAECHQRGFPAIDAPYVKHTTTAFNTTATGFSYYVWSPYYYFLAHFAAPERWAASRCFDDMRHYARKAPERHRRCATLFQDATMTAGLVSTNDDAQTSARRPRTASSKCRRCAGRSTRRHRN